MGQSPKYTSLKTSKISTSVESERSISEDHNISYQQRPLLRKLPTRGQIICANQCRRCWTSFGSNVLRVEHMVQRRQGSSGARNSAGGKFGGEGSELGQRRPSCNQILSRLSSWISGRLVGGWGGTLLPCRASGTPGLAQSAALTWALWSQPPSAGRRAPHCRHWKLPPGSARG